MSFIKSITIYENAATRVYINECHKMGKKTRVFAVRRDDKTGLAMLLGGIKFNPRWRQYVFEAEAKTLWSSGCMKNIIDFVDDLNYKWRRKQWSKT